MYYWSLSHRWGVHCAKHVKMMHKLWWLNCFYHSKKIILMLPDICIFSPLHISRSYSVFSLSLLDKTSGHIITTFHCPFDFWWIMMISTAFFAFLFCIIFIRFHSFFFYLPLCFNSLLLFSLSLSLSYTHTHTLSLSLSQRCSLNYDRSIKINEKID